MRLWDKVAERWVRVVAGTATLIFLGWVILACSKVPVAIAMGLPTVAIYFAFVVWALFICVALARRSWGLPIGRRLGGVWSQMQIWALLKMAFSAGSNTRFGAISLAISIASLLLGSWGEHADPAAAQPAVPADGTSPRR